MFISSLDVLVLTPFAFVLLVIAGDKLTDLVEDLRNQFSPLRYKMAMMKERAMVAFGKMNLAMVDRYRQEAGQSYNRASTIFL